MSGWAITAADVAEMSHYLAETGGVVPTPRWQSSVEQGSELICSLDRQTARGPGLMVVGFVNDPGQLLGMVQNVRRIDEV